MTGDEELLGYLKYVDLLNVNFQPGFCLIAEIEQGFIESCISKTGGNHKSAADLYNVVRDAFKDTFDCVVSNFILNKVIAFVPINKGCTAEWAKRYSLEAAKKIQDKISSKSGTVANIGIGLPQPDSTRLYNSYNQALHSLSYPGSGNTIHYFEGLEYNSVSPVISQYIDTEKTLMEKIRSGDEEGSIKHFNKLFFSLNNQFGSDPYGVLFYIMHLVIMISHLEYELIKKCFLYEKMKEAAVVKPEDLGYIKKILEEEIRRIARDVNENRNNQSEGLVAKACEFIRNSYFKPLTLENVAKHVAVNPFYLSKLFKVSLGQNFSDYVTLIRMHEAKRLLRETDISLKHIAYKVGYSDPDYFCKVFKKSMDFTPTEYRNRMKNKGAE